MKSVTVDEGDLLLNLLSKLYFYEFQRLCFFFFLHKRRYQHLHDVEKGFSFILPRFLAAHQKVSHCESQ